MIKYISLILLSSIPLLANANCDYRDRSYPEGTRIGGQICDENDRWIDKEEWLRKKENEAESQT